MSQSSTAPLAFVLGEDAVPADPMALMVRGSAAASVEAERRLLERAGELAALRTAVERASDGVPSVTMVLGEAGIGKSRLVRELGLAAMRDEVVVLGRIRRVRRRRVALRAGGRGVA